MKKSSFSLKNKISFILGGSGLIGRTVCLEFAKAGSVVCLIDKETSSSLKLLEELKKINSKCSFFQLDCSDFEQLEENFILSSLESHSVSLWPSIITFLISSLFDKI